MRLLHISATPFPTHQGTQVYLSGLMGAQVELGHEVTLLCWAHGSGSGPLGVKIVRTSPVPGGRRDRSGPHVSRVPQTASMYWTLRRLLAQEDFDLVHAHNIEGPWLASTLRRRPPLVHHLHTSMHEELPTYLRRGRRPTAWMGARLDRHLCRYADASLALSARGARLLQSWGANVVASVPPGIDLDALTGDPERARRDFDLGERRWVIYTGNLDGYQDLPELIAALSGSQLGLLVVTGSDPTELARLCATHHVIHRVVRTRSFIDTRDAMSAAAVGVVPRVRCAGFPMKVLNLVGAGLPVVLRTDVATGVPGCIQVDSVQQTVRELRGLIDSPDLCREIGQRARSELRASWTWRARAQQVDAFYARVPGVDPQLI
ncbi:MAG: glycosyltransferase involved in cell wall biosynthesis [Kiritimatiellia bacterium]|jgi:glycosyltransferase involved in cell wall biosynthesis